MISRDQIEKERNARLVKTLFGIAMGLDQRELGEIFEYHVLTRVQEFLAYRLVCTQVA